MSKQSLPITLSLHGAADTQGDAVVIDRSAAARVGRAAGALALSWAAAFLCIFIPILHFVLVPTLLITGIVLFVLRLREDRTLVEIHGACPRCKTTRVIAVGGRFRNGRTIHCDGCGDGPRLMLR